jgi:hypothetical protein
MADIVWPDGCAISAGVCALSGGRIPSGGRGQVCAYPLGTRLPYIQPGADRADRGHASGRKLSRECLRSMRLQRIGARHAVSCLARGFPAPATWAERTITVRSSYKPTSATAGHAATAAPIRPCPSP